MNNNFMSKYGWLFFICLCLPFAAYAVDPIEFKSELEEQRFQTLAKELRCLVCQNESLADSSAGLAQDLRAEVITQIRDGKNDRDIKTYMTERYGDFILYNPPIKSTTWLLWFGPFVLLIIGAVVVLKIIRGRKADTKNAAAADDPVKSDW
jgi:cytochrome c-type biogenesis protein CcmH